LDVQPTLEHESASHSTARAAEWLVARSPLSQALIQFCQRLTDEPRLGTLVILLRQKMSQNDSFGGGPADDTCDHGTRWPAAAAERPASRHILDLKVAPRKNDRASRPFGVRAGPRAASAEGSIGAVFTLEIGALFSLGSNTFISCAAR